MKGSYILFKNNAYNVIDFCTAEKNMSKSFLNQERSEAQDQVLNRNPINLIIFSMVERVLCTCP